jgi:hypothetical protein
MPDGLDIADLVILVEPGIMAQGSGIVGVDPES